MIKFSATTDKARIVAAYHNRSKVLFAYDRNGLVMDKAGVPLRAGNGVASAFWAGVDGMTRGARVPTRSMTTWPVYAAGKQIRKSEGIT